MSRSGYIDDPENNWDLIMWRGAVASATKGRRGQKLLTELVEALDAMPEKRLIAHELVCDDGVCALGSVARKRGIPVSDVDAIDPSDYDTVAKTFDIAGALAREIEWQNDEGSYLPETPEQRWFRIRAWAAAQIIPQATPL